MHGSLETVATVDRRSVPVRYLHSAHPLDAPAELRDRPSNALHTVVRPASYHSLRSTKPAAGSTPSTVIYSAGPHSIDTLRRHKRILEKELAEAQMRRSQANQDRDEAVKEVQSLRARLRRQRKKRVQDAPAAAAVAAAAIPTKEPSTTTKADDENLRPLHHEDEVMHMDQSPLHSRGSSLHDNLATEAKVEELTEQLKAAAENRAALETQVKTLTQENSALERRLEDALQHHSQDVDDLTAEKHKTEEALEDHKREHGAAQQKLAAREEAIKALQAQLEATTRRLQAYEQREKGHRRRPQLLEAQQGARAPTEDNDVGDHDDEGNETAHEEQRGREQRQQDETRASANEHDNGNRDDHIPTGSKEAWRLAMLKLRNMAVMLQSRLTDTQRELERQRTKCAETERRLSQTLLSHLEEKSRLKQLVCTEQARVQQLSITISAFREQSTRLQDELASYQVGEVPEEKERLQLELKAAREELVALQQCCQPFLQLYDSNGLGLQQMYPDAAATIGHASSMSSLSAKTGVQSAPVPGVRRPRSLHLPRAHHAGASMQDAPSNAVAQADADTGADACVALRASRAKNMALSRANQRLQDQVAYLQRQLRCHEPKGPTTPL